MVSPSMTRPSFVLSTDNKSHFIRVDISVGRRVTGVILVFEMATLKCIAVFVSVLLFVLEPVAAVETDTDPYIKAISTQIESSPV